MNNVELSVVIPVYNEAANLPELLRRCRAALEGLDAAAELILVDDGSTDASPQMIAAAAQGAPGAPGREIPVIGVLLAANFGQHAAIMAGMEQARGGYVVTLDADLQNPPEEIGRLLAELRGGADVVGTIRANRHDTIFRRLASRCVNFYTRLLCHGRTMQDYGCMLRGYRRPVVEAMLRCREHGKFIPMLAMSFANRVREIPVAHAERAAGESKYGLGKLIALQYDLLTGTSILPMRLLTAFGSLIAAFGVIFGIYIFIRSQIDKEWGAEGVFALFAVQFVLSGGIFAALGLIGEYIGKIHINVRGRPPYAIREIICRPEKSGKQA